MRDTVMRGHSGNEIPTHESYICICWSLRSAAICRCECHAKEDEVDPDFGGTP